MGPNLKCYYKVLELPKTADEAQIKRKYKELALKCHPDKNLHNVDAATKKFQLIKEAYDTLNDPQQRKSYDECREDLLKCGVNFQKYQENQKSDGQNREDGFYSVYRKVFQIISEENSNGSPIFGNSSSNYEAVVRPFYDYWLQYQAAENPKLKKEAVERSKEIRAFVAFVKRLDRRVTKQFNARKAESRKNKKKEQKPFDQNPKTEWTRYNSSMEEEMQQLEKEFDDFEKNQAKKKAKRKCKTKQNKKD